MFRTIGETPDKRASREYGPEGTPAISNEPSAPTVIFMATTVMPIDGNGSFASVIDAGEYRFWITGNARVSYPIDAQGRFEIPRLLPGSYDLEIQIFGHGFVRHSVVIDEEDIDLDLSARRFY